MKALMMQYSTVASCDTAPFNWQAAGMGYIFRSSEGRFIVIDGGREPDTEPLVERMEQLSEGKKPQIAYWVITHPHHDHYGALMGLAASEELRARVQLEKMLFCLPDENIYYENYKKALPGDVQNIMRAVDVLQVPVHAAKTGDILKIDDLALEVLLTVDDLEAVKDPNETSLIFRVLAGGQGFLFLGDTYSRPSRQLAAKMGESLKSDFCQLAHHALNGGADELYALVKPRVALVPMARPAYDEMLYGKYKDDHGTRHNRHVLQALPKNAQWIAADGDILVELPFNFGNLS